MTSFTVQLPLRITVEIDGGIPAPLAAGPGAALVPGSALDRGAEERIAIDPDYASRKGYDPDFLGREVALPVLNDEQRRNAARNEQAQPGEDDTVLPYHHFSIVMNRSRQLAYYTAVNIDGATARKPKREADRWSYDPRIAQSEQIGEELYERNSLDRGHLVRRLDPAWGDMAAAVKANDDTFHFTNCSPQHARFNQNNETWQGIENFLLAQATGQRRRLNVFTGPVMTDLDPLYRGVRLPKQFWKIAVYANDAEELVVTAYVLGQDELLDGLERFIPETYQVALEEVIGLTGLDFSPLLPKQVTMPGGAGMRPGALPRRKLTQPSDILLG